MAVRQTSPSFAQVTWADLEPGKAKWSSGLQVVEQIRKMQTFGARLFQSSLPRNCPALVVFGGGNECIWSRGRGGCVVVVRSAWRLGNSGSEPEPSGQGLEMPLVEELGLRGPQ